jgi:hypothetical protein
MILFDNKAKIKWEWDNLIKKKKKKLEAQLPAKQRLKDDLKKKSIFKKDKKIWLESTS